MNNDVLYAKDYPIGTTATDGDLHAHVVLGDAHEPQWVIGWGLFDVLSAEKFQIVYEPARTYRVGDIITAEEARENLPVGSVIDLADDRYGIGMVHKRVPRVGWLSTCEDDIFTGLDRIKPDVKMIILRLPDQPVQ